MRILEAVWLLVGMITSMSLFMTSEAVFAELVLFCDLVLAYPLSLIFKKKKND
jgi:hypothetical protein